MSTFGETFFHFAGDLDKTIHLLQAHVDPISVIYLDDGAFFIAGSNRHPSVRDELSRIPGVTLFPSKHSPATLGDKAQLLKSMKKAPQAHHTLYEALSNLGYPGYFDPEY